MDDLEIKSDQVKIEHNKEQKFSFVHINWFWQTENCKPRSFQFEYEHQKNLLGNQVVFVSAVELVSDSSAMPLEYEDKMVQQLDKLIRDELDWGDP